LQAVGGFLYGAIFTLRSSKKRDPGTRFSTSGFFRKSTPRHFVMGRFVMGRFVCESFSPFFGENILPFLDKTFRIRIIGLTTPIV
jgi:hypothetical protein